MADDDKSGSGNESGHLNSPSPEVIKEAQTLGWVPKERFKGREAEWVDADEFVRRGREILPILKKDKEKLLGEVTSLRGQLDELRTTAQQAYDFAYQAAEREWKDKYEALKAAKKKAVTEGDGDTLIEIEEALDEHKEAKPAKPAEKKTQADVSGTVNDPLFVEWKKANPWYGTDPKLTVQANMAGASLGQQGITGAELYEQVTELVKSMNPDKFEDVDPEKSRGGNGSGQTRRASSHTTQRTQDKRTYENLPQEAKDACEKFIKHGVYKGLKPEQAREKYVQNYQWD